MKAKSGYCDNCMIEGPLFAIRAKGRRHLTTKYFCAKCANQYMKLSEYFMKE